ncbi:baseplate J/gp47 family protein [uncultured Desulfobacter sp.]|uniref:baseplate J/gp47 family protein n=1 Tax=uncultured Desulfobacter sp. TaxID=240139 RepID=UPI0029F4851A|nr:baseplate J/gp47 family protein [uncultured Desulfobacter sp.]
MPLPQPEFDGRTYRELLNEAIARIPAHNPEWTNFNDTDPGITLLQLFAFMSESIIYRANLIPERNRQKFLRLLRLPMRPASAAKGLVTFQNPRGALKVFTLNENIQVSAGNVPFRTENGLDVLPVESKLYYKRPLSEAQRAEVEDLYRQLYAAYDLTDTELDFYETTLFEPAVSGVTVRNLDISRQTKDGALWVALLARQGEKLDTVRDRIKGKILSLGILPALDEEGGVLYPLGPAVREDQSSLSFEIPNAEDDRIRFTPLTPILDHDPLVQPGIVKLTLPSDPEKLKVWTEGPLTAGVGNRPPSLEETDEINRLITWIRIRASHIDTREEATSRQRSINLSWVGINAANIIQRTHVAAEQLSKGTGEPDQILTLTNTPVIKDTLQLTINGETWNEIDDLSAASPEVPVRSPRLVSDYNTDSGIESTSSKVYTLDTESGEIRFGNGAHGIRPPNSALIQAAYDHGGGSQGMVGINTIIKSNNLPSGIKVANPVPTWGGSQAETVTEAERRIPGIFRHRDRLVAKQDYIDIAKSTPGIDLGRVEVLPLFHPKLPRQTSDGVVTLMVIPQFDHIHPNAPQPDRLFLETVCAHLSPRRILTTELHIRGPEYQPIWISVGIDTVPGFDPAPVREKVKTEVENFVSPLSGGFEGQGWPLGKTVDSLEIMAAVTRVSGVAKVNGLRLGKSTDAEINEVIIEGLALPQLMKVVVIEGDAPTLEEIRGDMEQSTQNGEVLDTNVVPVPVIPPQC